MLTLYNTLTRKKEFFVPIKKGTVGMYSCGPTVYWYQHIGNLRTYLFADILKRTLLYNNYKVKHIINITDVGHLTSDADEGEDKMEKAAKKEGKNAQEIAGHYFGVFEEDLHKLNIISPTKWTKATEHIKEQIDLIKALEKNKFTYQTSDGVYFDSSKFPGYGKLANLHIDSLQEGKRISKGEKRNKTDFALWKFSAQPGLRQQEWSSPWGIGFPGWHIECSAMSMKYLGKHFDIHTGGQDHIPIHHTNEIAQSEAATKKKFVNYWLHGAFLLFKGEKVSKSSGGLYTLSELIQQGYAPMHLRYFYLLTHYKKPLNFTLENLDAAKTAFERLTQKVIHLKQQPLKGKTDLAKYESSFTNAINDDLNVPRAVQTVWELLDDLTLDHQKKLKILEKFDAVLGLDIAQMHQQKVNLSKDIKELVQAREQARQSKDFAHADILRQRIKEAGFVVQDTPQGPKVTKL